MAKISRDSEKSARVQWAVDEACAQSKENRVFVKNLFIKVAASS